MRYESTQYCFLPQDVQFLKVTGLSDLVYICTNRIGGRWHTVCHCEENSLTLGTATRTKEEALKEHTDAVGLVSSILARPLSGMVLLINHEIQGVRRLAKWRLSGWI